MMAIVLKYMNVQFVATKKDTEDEPENNGITQESLVLCLSVNRMPPLHNLPSVALQNQNVDRMRYAVCEKISTFKD